MASTEVPSNKVNVLAPEHLAIPLQREGTIKNFKDQNTVHYSDMDLRKWKNVLKYKNQTIMRALVPNIEFLGHPITKRNPFVVNWIIEDQLIF